MKISFIDNRIQNQKLKKNQNDQLNENSDIKIDNQVEKSQTNTLAQLITEPQQLKMLILAGTDIIVQQIHSLNMCQNLIQLDISSNSISTLPPSLDLSSLKKLQLLYLHNNLIQDMYTLQKFFVFQNLTYMTLFSNPISSQPNLRHFLVNQLQSLKAVDFNVISDEQRMDVPFGSNKFYAFSPSTQLDWPIVTYPNDTNLSEEGYLMLLRREIEIVNSKYSQNSAILMIQRVFRGYCIRQIFHSLRIEAREKLYRVITAIVRWKFLVWRNKRKRREVYDKAQQIVEAKFDKDIFLRFWNHYQRYKRQQDRRQRKNAAGLKLMYLIGRGTVIFREFMSNFEIQQYQRFYMRPQQLRLFKTILSITLAKLYNEQCNYNNPYLKDDIDDLKSIIDDTKDVYHGMNNFKTVLKQNQFLKETRHLVTLRLPEPFSQFYSQIPLIAFSRPSLECKVIFTKSSKWYYQVRYLPLHMEFSNTVIFQRKYNLKSYTKNFDKEKFDLNYNQLKAFQDKEYEGLISFNCENMRLMREILKQILVYNSCVWENYSGGSSFITQKQDSLKNKQERPVSTTIENEKSQQTTIFLTFFDSILRKVSAAIQIQKLFRMRKFRLDYIMNRKIDEDLSRRTQFDPLLQIKEIRAAIIIQRWYRFLEYQHRTCFFRELSFFIQSKVLDSKLFIHQALYMKLNSLFVENSQFFNYAYRRAGKKSRFLLTESNHAIIFDPISGYCRLAWNSGFQFYSLFTKQNRGFFPPWFETKWTPESASVAHQYEGDIMNILHVGSQVEMHQYGGMKYIGFEFKSVEEARVRVAMMALHTYRFSFNGFYIRLCNQATLSDFPFILPYQFLLQKIYNIPHDTEKLNKIMTKQVDNKLSLFISSFVHSQFIEKSTAISFQKKFLKQSLFTNPQNKHPTRIQSNIMIFLHTNMYMNQEDVGQKLFQVKDQKRGEDEVCEHIFVSNLNFSNLQFAENSRDISSRGTQNHNTNSIHNIRPHSMIKIDSFGQMDSFKKQLSRNIEQMAQRPSFIEFKNKEDVKNFLDQRKQLEFEQKKIDVETIQKSNQLMKELNKVQQQIQISKIRNQITSEKIDIVKNIKQNQERSISENQDKISIIKTKTVRKKEDDQWIGDVIRSQNFLSKQQAIFFQRQQERQEVKQNKRRVQDHQNSAMQQLNMTQISNSEGQSNINTSAKLTQNSKYYLVFGQNHPSNHNSNSQTLNINNNNSNNNNTAIGLMGRDTQNELKEQIDQNPNLTHQIIKDTSFNIKNIQFGADQGYNSKFGGSNSQNNNNYNNNNKLPSLNQGFSKKIQEFGQYLRNNQQFNSQNNSTFDLYQNKNLDQTHNSMQQDEDLYVVPQEIPKQLLRIQQKGAYQMSDQIIHSVFPEEFYPIATGKSQFLF